MRSWYLIQSKPAAESVAQANLERQGYGVYFPRLYARRRWRASWCNRVVALFPRYLFVQLDQTRQSLSPVRSTVGVADVVRFGASPALVSDKVIHELRSREDPETGLHRLSNSMELEPGMVVRITGGPFDGLEGVFEREDGSDRVVLLLKVLGQAARVRMPADVVEAA